MIFFFNNIDFFYTIFFIISILSSINVIISRNPLHSIIYLILVFCNIVFILLLQELEFLSMVFLIVYIGAIAVLFLFVIYMLNLKIIELNESNLQYLIGIIISFFIILLILVYSFYNNNIMIIENNYYMGNNTNLEEYINYGDILYNNNNIKIISKILYNNNYIYFIIVGLILLVSMIGVIILTSNKTFFLKEQIIFEQIKRFIKI